MRVGIRMAATVGDPQQAQQQAQGEGDDGGDGGGAEGGADAVAEQRPDIRAGEDGPAAAFEDALLGQGADDPGQQAQDEQGADHGADQGDPAGLGARDVIKD